jgi:hypothetical protein
MPLDSFEVTFGEGVRPELARAEDASEIRRWAFASLPAPPGYVAALVLERRTPAEELTLSPSGPDPMPPGGGFVTRVKLLCSFSVTVLAKNGRGR